MEAPYVTAIDIEMQSSAVTSDDDTSSPSVRRLMDHQLPPSGLSSPSAGLIPVQDREHHPDESERGSTIEVAQSTKMFEQADREVRAEAQRTERDIKDVEAQDGAGGEFNLRTYFQDSIRTRQSNAGTKRKMMGMSVRDLTVVGQGADATSIATNISVLKVLWPPNWFNKSVGTPFNILHKVNAFCNHGEMLLVLGRPGAGCTTFLRMAANTPRAAYVRVEGSVTYGGMSSEEMLKYPGETIYVPEEDVHYPSLTLQQTLDFALKLKTPGNRLPEESHRNFRSKVFNLLMKMYGLAAQAHTLVGNEWVRGLSGGERKRATICEASIARGTVECWDCSTRGLDAASALDYAKSLRIMSDTMDKTTVASFYQASENIYELFDKVLVLEKGRCIYFGPTKLAKQYFLDLGFDCEPRKSTPDFLTGITNPQERLIRPGFEDTVPTTSVALEQAWIASSYHANMLDEQTRLEQEVERAHPSTEFVQEVHASKSRRAQSDSIYSATLREQVASLVVRQFQVWYGNKFGIFSRYFSVICQALIYGSVFYQMPLSASGIYSRGAALFGALMFNGFLSGAEIPATFVGRRIMQKQKSYAMYHPFTFHLAQVAFDIPLVTLQTFVFSIIVYFMYGLDRVAGKFFIFLFTTTLLALCSTQMFRLMGNLSPSLYLSQQVQGVFLILLLTYTGFAPPYDKMHPWLQWVHWIDPFAYAFKALFTNEMKGLVIDCSKSGYIPAGPGYDDEAYRVCALVGATPGSTTVSAQDYLQRTYGFDVNLRAVYIIAIFLFWILFTICNALALEYIDWVHGGHTQRIYKAGKAPKQNDEAAEKLSVEKATRPVEAATIIETRAGVFNWKDIKYTVPVKGGTRLLLDNVEGWIKPGQMTALMGSSGAGKTTLLDVLAQRKTQGKVEGSMMLNGRPLRIDFERITGYVEQMDVFNPYLTVRENLLSSARMRQDRTVPDEDKKAYVERVLEMMEMKYLGDALIGDLESAKGISVEERKRLTIGMELVAKPHILFLDEPTSGLDAQSSYNIIKFIRKLADAGMPLVCTIHQPSSVLFEHFDRLLLLARGGKTVYFGDIGEHSSTLTGYFERHGSRACTQEENPAEYILEAIGAGVSGHTDMDWPALWKSSPECHAVHQELEDMDNKNNGAASGSGHGDEKEPTEFATNFWYQLWQLYLRFNIVFWRNPDYNLGRIFKALLVGLVVGFSFWKEGVSSSDLQYRVLAIFQILILGIMLIHVALPNFMFLRNLFQRDYASKFYSAAPFSLAVIMVELPYLLVAGSLCMCCCYWSIGFQTFNDSSEIAFFWIAFVLFIWYCNSFGQMVGSMSTNMGISFLFLPLLTSTLFLFCGVLAPRAELPYFWRSWMYELDPFRYFMEAIITNTFFKMPVVCKEADLIRFNPPSGQTCAEYTKAFFASGANGYIANPEATTDCGYCEYSSGKEFYNSLGWSETEKSRDLGIVACFMAFNIGIACLFVYMNRRQSR